MAKRTTGQAAAADSGVSDVADESAAGGGSEAETAPQGPWRVVVGNLVGHSADDIVTSEDLAGSNIAALVAGGHIESTNNNNAGDAGGKDGSE